MNRGVICSHVLNIAANFLSTNLHSLSSDEWTWLAVILFTATCDNTFITLYKLKRVVCGEWLALSTSFTLRCWEKRVLIDQHTLTWEFEIQEHFVWPLTTVSVCILGGMYKINCSAKITMYIYLKYQFCEQIGLLAICYSSWENGVGC